MNRKSPPNKIVKKLTQADVDAFDYKLADSFHQGYEKAKHEFSITNQTVRLHQLQACAKLTEEIGRMASRVGYMLDKLGYKL